MMWRSRILYIGKRFGIVLAELILLALLVIVLLIPSVASQWLNGVENMSIALRLVLLVIVASAVFFIAYRQLFPPQTEETDGKLTIKASGTLASISTQSVRERILDEMGQVPRVGSVDANIKAVKGKAKIDLEVGLIGKEINVPSKQKELDTILKQIVTNQLGIQFFGKPTSTIHFEAEKVETSGAKPAVAAASKKPDELKEAAKPTATKEPAKPTKTETPTPAKPKEVKPAVAMKEEPPQPAPAKLVNLLARRDDSKETPEAKPTGDTAKKDTTA